MLLWLAASGCFRTRQVGPGAEAGPDGPGRDGPNRDTPRAGASAEPELLPAEEAARLCQRGGECRGLGVERPDKLDVLVVMDNSGESWGHQDLFAEAAPALLRALTSGDFDGDGRRDLPPVRDIQLGVVSSDLGAGPSGIDRCDGAGDDGVLLTRGLSPDCALTQPARLFFDNPASVMRQAATIECKLRLGEEGCGFEQPLEAMLKALTPASSALAFAGPTGQQDSEKGHGSDVNDGFLRDGVNPSLLAVIQVAAEDDCSALDESIFTPPRALSPDHPLSFQDLNLRCYFNPQALHPVSRYIDGLRALRPGHPDRLFFATVAGYPQEVAADEFVERWDLMRDDGRDAYFDSVLSDARMEEDIDTSLAMGSRKLVPSCVTDDHAWSSLPPRRLTQVAAGLGAGSVLQSSCAQDPRALAQRIGERLAARMHGRCTDIAVERRADLTVPCDLVVGLPEGRDCADFAGLRSRDGASGICQVEQLAFDDGRVAEGEGWYYDDHMFHAAACDGDGDRMVVVTRGVRFPADARMALDCR